MKIAVVAANGRAGSKIVDEAVTRGLDVTAIVRGENKTKAQHVIQKDIYDLTAEDLAPFDVVVDAFGTWDENKMGEHETTLQHLCDLLAHKKTRLIVVGGVGGLYTDKEHKHMLYTDRNFPQAYYAVASAMATAFTNLRKRLDVNWTYVAPAMQFIFDAPKTGKYKTAGEMIEYNKDGESKISYADFASALVDEIIVPKHIKERFSVYQE